jgi:glycosyltransferase involved in cell wall biosynthesis
MPGRRPRLAFLLLPGLDHFAHELIAALPDACGWDVRGFDIRTPEDLGTALQWTDDVGRDALWFEFCWPPFPRMIAETAFAGRRVILRVHRIEAYGSDHVAGAPWHKIDDVVVVSADMAARVRWAAPQSAATTRLHVVHNGLDLDRFAPAAGWDPFRIGWCGNLTLHKNPTLALQVLFSLRLLDDRYTLRLSGKGIDPVAQDAFFYLARRLDLTDAIRLDGAVAQADMPAWHAGNGILLSTSAYESFGYAICEAAAVGCDLAVLDHVGAEEFWPEAVRFGTVEEAAWLIRKAAPMRWREHVAQRFSLARQTASIARLLGAGRRAGAAEFTAPPRRAVPALPARD